MVPVPVTVRFVTVPVFQAVLLPAIVHVPEPIAMVLARVPADAIPLDAALNVTL